MDALGKGTSGGRSIFFIRRGTIAAEATFDPTVHFFDIDAGTPSGCGAFIGEHTLMAKAQCVANYTAVTRCELYALGVHDLHRIANNAALASTEYDAAAEEIAEIIYAEFARRHLLRVISLYFLVATLRSERSHGRNYRGLSSAESTAQYAALRLQVKWLQRMARRMLRGSSDSRSIDSLVPGLFLDSNVGRDTFKKSRKSLVISSASPRTSQQSRATQRSSVSSVLDNGRQTADDLQKQLARLEQTQQAMMARQDAMGAKLDAAVQVITAAANEMAHWSNPNAA